MMSKFVAQVYVYGDSLKASLVAIVVPDEEVVVRWAGEGGREGTFQELCKTQVRERGCVGVGVLWVCVWCRS